MRKFHLGSQREVVVTWKKDGNASHQDHLVHKQFISATQVHGTGIYVVPHEHHEMWKHHSEVDALYTVYDKAIGVYVADCLPLVLVGNHSHAVVHCSRRTLHAELVQWVLEQFLQHHDTITYAYLGPCIKR